MAAEPDLAETTWRGRPAWRLAGGGLEAVFTRQGAQLASLRLAGDAVEPMWQPDWPAAGPGAGDPAIFGHGPEAGILPCIVGSFACIDRFGAPHPGEDRPVHGEAKEVDYDGGLRDGALVMRAACPRTDIRLARRAELAGGRLRLATTVVHAGAEAREVEWCEHFTLGDPFLDGAVFEAGATRAWRHLDDPERARFPDDGPLAERPAAEVLPAPPADAPPAGDIYALAVDEPWAEAVNPRLGRRLRLGWDATAFGWLCLWTEHRSRTPRPWNGRARARGLELSTKPFPEGAPPASRHPRFAGRDSSCLVPPGAEGLTKTVEVEWTATA